MFPPPSAGRFPWSAARVGYPVLCKRPPAFGHLPSSRRRDEKTEHCTSVSTPVPSTALPRTLSPAQTAPAKRRVSTWRKAATNTPSHPLDELPVPCRLSAGRLSSAPAASKKTILRPRGPRTKQNQRRTPKEGPSFVAPSVRPVRAPAFLPQFALVGGPGPEPAPAKRATGANGRTRFRKLSAHRPARQRSCVCLKFPGSSFCPSAIQQPPGPRRDSSSSKRAAAGVWPCGGCFRRSRP